MAKTKEKPEFLTKEPVNDLLLAIYLLAGGWNDSTRRFLATHEFTKELPFAEILIEHWGGGYGKCEYTGTDRIQVTAEVVKQLLQDRWVFKANERQKDPFLYAHEAYKLSEGSRNDWNDRGYEKFMRERRERAKAHFIAGTHSKFSSVLFDQGYDWKWETERDEDGKEDWRQRRYRLYFDFKTPMDEHIRIWDDTGEVEKLKK